MSSKLTRREFCGRSLAAGTALAAGWHVNPRPAVASKSSLEKLNIAAVGTAAL